MSGPQTGATYYHTQLRQGWCNQRVGCMLGIMDRIYNLWDGYLDKCKVFGLVPCCGQDGYRAQVLKQPIDRFIQIHITYDKVLRQGKILLQV